MSRIEEFFKTDSDWLEAKKKVSSIKTDGVLNRSDFLKTVGWHRYSEAAYQEYSNGMKQTEEELPKFLFQNY